jgi:hypothetical protein
MQLQYSQYSVAWVVVVNMLQYAPCISISTLFFFHIAAPSFFEQNSKIYFETYIWHIYLTHIDTYIDTYICLFTSQDRATYKRIFLFRPGVGGLQVAGVGVGVYGEVVALGVLGAVSVSMCDVLCVMCDVLCVMCDVWCVNRWMWMWMRMRIRVSMSMGMCVSMSMGMGMNVGMRHNT